MRQNATQKKGLCCHGTGYKYRKGRKCFCRCLVGVREAAKHLAGVADVTPPKMNLDVNGYLDALERAR